jgi:predicted nucleotidyltransferase
MNERYFNIIPDGRKSIIDRLKSCLESHRDIVFAYLHGSFAIGDRFKDIDIAVYLDPLPSSPLQVELEIETELGDAIKKYPVDVRVLNNSPLSFRYNVIKHGEPIVVHDDDLRSDFVETTLSNYFDFSPFLKIYLKEALGSGI